MSKRCPRCNKVLQTLKQDKDNLQYYCGECLGYVVEQEMRKYMSNNVWQLERDDKYQYTIPANRSDLRIGLLGYTANESIEGVKQILEANREQVETYKICQFRAYIKFKDGSTLESIFPNQYINGMRLDQLILFDDNRWRITENLYMNILHILAHTLQFSKVSEENQVIKYERY